MKRSSKILLVIVLLFMSRTAFAFQELKSFKKEPSKIAAFFSRIWECKLSPSCYRSKPLGAFTQLTSGDTLSAFPTTYNANLAITLETGTTSVGSITTLPNLTSAPSLSTVGAITSLPNLATVGTITSGTWNGGVIPVTSGGTGVATLAVHQVVLGDNASVLYTVSGVGTAGQFLTSNGAGLDPTWQTGAINLASSYAWTGYHVFNASTTFASNAKVNISASTSIEATTNIPLILNRVAYGFPAQDGLQDQSLTTNSSGRLEWRPKATTSITLIPPPVTSNATTTTQLNITDNTQLECGLYNIPFDMTFKSISVFHTDDNVSLSSGRFNIGIYSKEGKLIFSTTTPRIDSSTKKTVRTSTWPNGASKTATSSQYYFCMQSVSTESEYFQGWGGSNTGPLDGVSGQPDTIFTMTGVTGGVLPTTLVPTSGNPQPFAPMFRLDD